MTDFSPERVRDLAHLARLKLTDVEIDRISRELADVLKYVELCNEVDTASVEPMAHAVELANVFREDATRPSLERSEALANAPQTDGTYFVVPAILAEG